VELYIDDEESVYEIIKVPLISAFGEEVA